MRMCIMLTSQGGYQGVSFAVENLLDEDINFELDCSKSKNVMSHR